jgi:hypothetical protein
MEGKMKKLIDAGLFLLIALMVVSYVAYRERGAGQAHAAEVQAEAPLKVTLYVGRSCVMPNGVLEETVLTNDDADERLQHCAGGVVWKELRRE